MSTRMKIAQAVNLFGLIVTVSFIATVGTGFVALNQLKVGGPLYERIVLGKDLIADILPPPAYILEAYLETTLALNEPGTAAAHRARLVQLRKDYDERHAYWQKQDFDPKLRELLTVNSDAEAARFWDKTEKTFLPALQAGDLDTARRAYADMTKAYEAHRAVIDKIVDGANAMNAQTETDAKERDGFYSAIVWGVSAVVLVILIGGVLAIVFAVIKPVIRMTGVMAKLAEGDHTVDVPSVGRGDEIGSMAAAVNVFKENAIQAEKVRASQEQERAKAEEDKNLALRNMADKVEQETHRVVEEIAKQTGEMAANAENMSRSADAVSANSQSVAAAATEAQANIGTVASASEELSASISEIASQITASKKATSEAVEASLGAQETIGALTSAVEQIGAVTKLINDIASQTNLLALNATIEAARAGEAGKGFAVVASEVKNLASQSAKATEEITSQITAIQTATDHTVRSVKAITESVYSIEGLSTAISAAIEEQSATTNEIARNVAETSGAAQEVAERIVNVSQEAGSTGVLATNISALSASVAESVENLKTVLIRVVRTSTKEVERRRKPRYNIARSAQVSIDGKTFSVTVENCSEGGALFVGDTGPLRAGSRVSLTIDGVRGALASHVLSVTKAGVHVKFDDSVVNSASFAEQFQQMVRGLTALAEAA